MYPVKRKGINILLVILYISILLAGIMTTILKGNPAYVQTCNRISAVLNILFALFVTAGFLRGYILFRKETRPEDKNGQVLYDMKRGHVMEHGIFAVIQIAEAVHMALDRALIPLAVDSLLQLIVLVLLIRHLRFAARYEAAAGKMQKAS